MLINPNVKIHRSKKLLKKLLKNYKVISTYNSHYIHSVLI